MTGVELRELVVAKWRAQKEPPLRFLPYPQIN